jgi:predicted regulator of Ras-like GTPase activity (Roadblock/LC7/MglB family)
MSHIQDVVTELKRAPGVRGAALLTSDGLVAASALATGLDADVIAGLASYMMMATARSLREGGYGACTRLVLNATHGKAVLVELEDSYLVVLFDQFAEVEQAEAEVDEAVERIQQASRVL